MEMKSKPLQVILSGLSVLMGLVLTYVDSQPNWDDTGILAGGILLFCGLVALLGYQRPWLLALLVGAGIPLHGILGDHNIASLLALVIAFIGSYAGWLIRLAACRAIKVSGK